MKFIDTHTHLYSTEFGEDIDAVIKRAERAGVEKFYLPAIDSTTLDAMLSLEERYPGKCIAMIGLHPCSVKENYKDELQLIESLLGRRKFAAIGEIGLDYYWDNTFVTEQQEVFEIQSGWALKYHLPIVIHSRNATGETIATIRKFSHRGLRGIFHCFGGTYEEAMQIIDAGFYLGIGGVATYKNSGLANVLGKIALEHIVLETDAPYLTPVPFRGKRNESSYVELVAKKIAEIKSCEVEEVAQTTTKNAENIFGL